MTKSLSVDVLHPFDGEFFATRVAMRLAIFTVIKKNLYYLWRKQIYEIYQM